MPEYRAYLLDRDGRIKHRVELTCEDEEAAKERAKLLVDGHDVELWLGTRRVATFRHLQS
jgi:hypothetical protein